MTQEEKDKLLKYLCMALPYGVKVQYNGSSIRLIQAIRIEGNEPYFKSKEVAGWLDVGSCKPYLRPMSSMTGEEMEELEAVSAADICNPLGIEYYGLHTESFAMKYEYFGDITGWLLAHHFDFMGLIDEGPALEAPEGMYNF